MLALHSGRMKQAKPCFWSSYRVIVMRRGSPYTPSFNRIIRAAQESGLIPKWWHRFYEDFAISQQIRNVNASSQLIEANIRRHRPENDSYWRVLFLLFAGYLLSLAVFSIELIFKHFHAKLQRRWRMSTGFDSSENRNSESNDSPLLGPQVLRIGRTALTTVSCGDSY
ncbi:unnamed protein product [Trichogramma brassicae]|uniref:Ionotropic glutamate receptor C-terminal domain-containing protein n=1 Tax=Trichogramma brassicae TaxID=86971 RepID=A0A6H5HYD2_9HYME|nr:unnamed protein product [Trichogramma brassicae]